MTKYLLTFPSPCGVWVVSGMRRVKLKKYQVSVPLRGVGCFPFAAASSISFLVSAPLRGVGCFWHRRRREHQAKVSVPLRGVGCFLCGDGSYIDGIGFRPLAGCGLFLERFANMLRASSFRPLAGCGLFRASQTRRSSRSRYPSPCGVWVVSTRQVNQMKTPSFRPLAGCGLFLSRYQYRDAAPGFRPLAGCGLFPEKRTGGITMTTFPSPCGVWVVSAPPCTQIARRMCFRPLAGCGLFLLIEPVAFCSEVSVPLRGGVVS